MAKLRLLYVSHCFPPPGRPMDNLGGMQRAAIELRAALQAHEHIALQDCLLESSERSHYIGIIPYFIRALRQIRQLARAGEIDAVLFSAMPTAWMATMLRSVLAPLGIPMATVCHGHDVTMDMALYQKLVPKVFAALDGVLPVSRATGHQCLQRGLAKDKLFVTPNGVDLDRFVRRAVGQPADRALLADFGLSLPEGALLLCSVGRQVERKGFAWFVDQVMPALPDNVHYWLAGAGPEQKAIAAAIDARGLEARVKLLGRVTEEQLSRLYRGADLFVMPNVPVAGDMEGFGLVLVEAGLSGLPAVAAGIEGILDVVTDGVNGHLVPTRDVAGFVAAIESYLEDPAKRIIASDRTAAHTAATFGWAAVAQSMYETLQQLRARL